MIYLNQSLRQNFITGLDDAQSDSVELKYRKPDGTRGSKIPQLVEASTGSYYVDWLPEELNQLGIWKFWSFIITIDEQEFPSEPWGEEIISEGSNITSVEEVKSYLGITVTTYDTQIELLIPLVEEDYLGIRNIPWDQEDDVITYPIGSDVTAAEMIGYKLSTTGRGSFDAKDYGKTVAGQSLDAHSISYAIGTGSGGNMKYGYPKDVISSIKIYMDAT